MKKETKGFTKAEFSWMLYDLTTNGYATIILAAIFPIYLSSVMGHNTLGLQLKGYGSAFVMLISAISCPILGVIGDSKGMKKKLWVSFVIAGALLTMSLAFTNTWEFLLAGYILSNIAYNSATLFYDSFITDIATKDRMHRVSTWGFAVGYFGGGTILLIITVILMAVMKGDPTIPVKASFILCGLWWLGFSLPMLLNAHQVHYNTKPMSEVLSSLGSQLLGTMKNIYADKALFTYVVAYFFYIDGVGTVINMATSYGTTLGLGTTSMILALLCTQLVAVPFSILFGRLATKRSAINMILFAIGVYIVICIIGFYMGYSVESSGTGMEHGLAISHATILFWTMAVLVGTVQGGIQALSRSHFGRIIPQEKSNEYFGFFNIFNRFASIIGPFLIAIITGITGQASFGILSIIILFIIGAILLMVSPKSQI
ncbi:MFS transporter [Lactovum miscens]|uniref:UMF1 family MFS transporter n=1 Tax=Lactovum miscens TaxID=190387 RepID=A0A841C6K7_9LACT|nr:MFS transporter [Lactovum miscens]MBB5887907.1 UMF1 family MFS transporter [Lactovum miscens]